MVTEEKADDLVRLSFGRKLQIARQQKAERDGSCSQQDVVDFLNENIPELGWQHQHYSAYELDNRKRPPNSNVVTWLAVFFDKPISALAEYQYSASPESPSRAELLRDLDFITEEDFLLLKTMTETMVNRATNKEEK
tara:strand:+ start:163 stop:573 length:411 start_codon:yes stop_codon:yes gene_type:complete